MNYSHVDTAVCGTWLKKNTTHVVSQNPPLAWKKILNFTSRQKHGSPVTPSFLRHLLHSSRPEEPELTLKYFRQILTENSKSLPENWLK